MSWSAVAGRGKLLRMANACTFDAELLRRYDRPGPRYTSYPTAPQFSPTFGEDALRLAARESNDEPVPRPLSIYVHVPFCTSPCFYCGCNRIITRDVSNGVTYLARLEQEIAMTSALSGGSPAERAAPVQESACAVSARPGAPDRSLQQTHPPSRSDPPDSAPEP